MKSRLNLRRGPKGLITRTCGNPGGSGFGPSRSCWMSTPRTAPRKWPRPRGHKSTRATSAERATPPTPAFINTLRKCVRKGQIWGLNTGNHHYRGFRKYRILATLSVTSENLECKIRAILFNDLWPRMSFEVIYFWNTIFIIWNAVYMLDYNVSKYRLIIKMTLNWPRGHSGIPFKLLQVSEKFLLLLSIEAPFESPWVRPESGNGHGPSKNGSIKRCELLNEFSYKPRIYEEKYYCDFEAECEAKNVAFETIEDVDDHWALNHVPDEDKIVPCNFCHVKFATRTARNVHIKRDHVKEWKCAQCQDSFYTKGQ